MARETSTQCIPGPATSSEGSTKPPQHLVRAGDLELGARVACRSPSAPCSSSAGRIPRRRTTPPPRPSPPPRSCRGRTPRARSRSPRRLMRTESRTDSSSASLLTARARSNSTSNGTSSIPVERLVVAHGHDVVEPVDADALPAPASRLSGDVLARGAGGTPARAQSSRARRRTAPPRGRRRRRPVSGHDDVGVAVDDLEPRHVRDGALEPAVLAARRRSRASSSCSSIAARTFAWRRSSSCCSGPRGFNSFDRVR